MTIPLSARPHLESLRAYDLDAPESRFALANNTNAFGVPPSAIASVRAVTDRQLVHYPTPFSPALREAIAAYAGVRPEEVIVGCGSDDVLDCALRAFAPPGGTVAHVAPTFVMARVFALTNSLVPVAVPLTPSFDANAEGLLAVGGSVFYLCSPNNPTGGLHSPAAVDRVLEQAAGLVLLDEAYAEYAGRSRAAQAPGHGRLLVLRTLSKAFGLAGLRVGYGIGAASLIRELEKVRGPYKVTAVAEAAALAALEHDLSWMRHTVRETLASRDEFVAALQSAGRVPLPSDANFILLPVADAAAASRALLARGIHVRAFTGLPAIGDALRITVGPRDVMRFVIDQLLEVT
ncbi:MAG TPA: histidinol-phosphate transaminase [Gemmatimonadaceae bacterium]